MVSLIFHYTEASSIVVRQQPHFVRGRGKTYDREHLESARPFRFLGTTRTARRF